LTSRYQSGVADYIEVLDAERERLATEDALAASNAQITTNLVRLYKALGGGWESLLGRAAPEAEAEEGGKPDAG